MKADHSVYWMAVTMGLGKVQHLELQMDFRLVALKVVERVVQSEDGSADSTADQKVGLMAVHWVVPMAFLKVGQTVLDLAGQMAGHLVEK